MKGIDLKNPDEQKKIDRKVEAKVKGNNEQKTMEYLY